MPDHRHARGRRHRFQLAAGALTIALAATGCSTVSSLAARNAAHSPGDNVSALGSDLGLSSAAPSGSVVPPNPAGPPKDPFTGTPADHWADGAAGIVLPKAEPVGGYTAAQLRDAYQTTKKLLIAANLDKQTLLGGPPTAFENLLIPPQRTWFVQNLNKVGLDKQGYPLSSRTMVMAFPPGDAQLIGSVIKVHGGMSARASVVHGSKELDVKVDYLFTYPVEPPGQPTEWMRVVNEAVWTVQFSNWQGAPTAFAPWVDVAGGGISGARCGTKDGYQYPDYPVPAAVPNPSDSPSGTPVNPYETSGPQPSGPDTCKSTTGT